MGILVDSNVLLDIFTRGEWLEWSANAVAHYAERDTLCINPLIYAEVSPRFRTIEELDEALPIPDFKRIALPWEAGFLAARAYTTYRARGGVRNSTLPDFYIGAHAAIAGMSLLTRDASRYRSYFPSLRLIAPQ